MCAAISSKLISPSQGRSTSMAPCIACSRRRRLCDRPDLVAHVVEERRASAPALGDADVPQHAEAQARRRHALRPVNVLHRRRAASSMAGVKWRGVTITTQSPPRRHAVQRRVVARHPHIGQGAHRPRRDVRLGIRKWRPS
jgi:hypothetical protein